jgi:hypothetical protein
MPKNANRSHCPDENVIKALLKLSGLDEEEAELELRYEFKDTRTPDRVLKCKEPVAPGTLETVAIFFTKKLAPLKLEAEHLVSPTPALRKIVNAVLNPTPVNAIPAFTLYDSQDRALEKLKAHFPPEKHTLEENTVHLVTFTLDTLLDEVMDVFQKEYKAKQVHLYLGTAGTAEAIKSKRQKELIQDLMIAIDRKLSNDTSRRGDAWKQLVNNTPDQRLPVRTERVSEFRFSAPPTFQGYYIPGVVVCVGWFGWFPTFDTCSSDTRVPSILSRYASKSIDLGNCEDDKFTLNGWQMPHVQAFNVPGADAAYKILEENFKLFIEAHKLDVELRTEEAAKKTSQ